MFVLPSFRPASRAEGGSPWYNKGGGRNLPASSYCRQDEKKYDRKLNKGTQKAYIQEKKGDKKGLNINKEQHKLYGKARAKDI